MQGTASTAKAAVDSNLIPGQYIVVFKSRWKGLIKNAKARQALQFVNTRINDLGISAKAIKHRYQHALRGFAAKLTPKQLKALKKDPQVKYIEQDQKFKAFNVGAASNSAAVSTVASSASGQTIPWGIDRVDGPFDGTGKKAWIIGAGVDLNNQDLNVDVNNSTSFVANETAQDVIGHGTYVAGLLAAKNNNQGVVGVAAGATVVGVKVIAKNDSGSVSDLVEGLNYVEGKASLNDIVNMSLGGPTSTAVDDAVIAGANKGIKFVISAGNLQTSAENVSPARVQHTNVWTVSAFRQGDEFSAIFDYAHCGNPNAGSDYGNPPIEYSEPGERIKSLLIGGGVGMGYNGPCTASGTSYAAPILSGLLLAAPMGIATDGAVSNDPDGNPDSIAVAVQPLSAVINGPVTLSSGQVYTWTAQVYHQKGSVSYQWYRKNAAGDSWQQVSNTTDSYQTYFDNTTSGPIHPKLKVVVTSAGETATPVLTLDVQSSNCNRATTTSSGISPDNVPPCN